MTSTEEINLDMKFITPFLAFGPAGSKLGQIDGARALAQDSKSDNIYLSEAVNHRMQVFSSKGVALFTFGDKEGQGKMQVPAGVCIHGNIVFVNQWDNHTLNLYTLGGEFITKIGGNGSTENKFIKPIGVAYDKQYDKLYVCDYGNNRLKVYDDWCPKVKATIPYPFDVKISETRIIVNSGSNMCLFFFDRKCEFIVQTLSSNTGATSMIGNPSYFDLDPSGDIWLSDYQRHCICQISSNGVLKRRFGKASNATRLSNVKGAFAKPTGLLVNRDGDLLSVCMRDEFQFQYFNVKQFRST